MPLKIRRAKAVVTSTERVVNSTERMEPFIMRDVLQESVSKLWKIIFLLLEPGGQRPEASESFVMYYETVYKMCANSEHQKVVDVLAEAFFVHARATALLLLGEACRMGVEDGRKLVESLDESDIVKERRSALADIMSARGMADSSIGSLHAELWTSFRKGLLMIAHLFAHLDSKRASHPQLYVESFGEKGETKERNYTGVTRLGIYFWYEEIVCGTGFAVTRDILSRIRSDRLTRGWRSIASDEDRRPMSDEDIRIIRVFLESLLLVGEGLVDSSDDVEDEDVYFDDLTREESGPLLDYSRDVFEQGEMHMTDASFEPHRTHFERAFLEETLQFYQLEGNYVLKNTTTTEYIRAVHDNVLVLEMRLATKYIHPRTVQSLEKVLGDALVTRHADILVAQAPMYIQEHQEGDMRRLFALLGRMDGHLKILQENLRDQIALAGTEAMKNFALNSEPASSTQGIQTCLGEEVDVLRAEAEAERFVSAAWRVYSQYQQLVSSAFKKEKAFELALDQGCRRFLNAVPGAADHLAMFANKLLARNMASRQMTESGLEDKLDRFTRLFRYLNDKEMFHSLYKVSLARRLINNTSVSKDTELAMISRIEQVCGRESIVRIQKMFQDLEKSSDLTSLFRKVSLRHAPELAKIDISVMVLTSSCWPPVDGNSPDHPEMEREGSSSSRFRRSRQKDVPNPLSNVMKLFVSYYASQRANRKLTWQPSLSKVRLLALFGQKTFELDVSFDLAVMLLRFNELDEISVEPDEHELADGLLASYIVTWNSGSKTLCVNESFSLERPRLSLMHLQKRPDLMRSQSDFARAKKSAEEDRSLEVQAEIVRLMKKSGTMNHSELIEQTISGLSNRFQATVIDVKRQIDGLIERDYLIRSPETPNEYAYVA